MTRKTISGAMLTLLLMCMLTLAFKVEPVKSDPRTIYVDDNNTTGPWDGTPEHPYQNITSAVEHASAGDTIYVYNGTYYENVVVNKRVTLFGENKDTTTIVGVVVSPAWEPVISVLADDVKITNFTVTNGSSGIRLTAQRGTVTDCIAYENLFGLAILYPSSQNFLRRNQLYNNSYNLHVLGTRSIDTFVQDIDTSNLVNGKPVYYLVNKENLYINPITFPNIGYLGIVNSTNVQINDLSLLRNGEGLLIAFSRNTLIENVEATNNYKGISVMSSPRTTVKRSSFSYNHLGIYLYYSDNVDIKENTISHNEGGIRLINSDFSVTYHNNFIKNYRYYQAWVDPSYYCHWNDSYPSGGNYWSDYTGVDVKKGPNQNQPGSDGIGDTPYVIDADNRDYYPLMHPFGSPPPPTYTLTINASGNGTTYSPPGIYTYSQGQNASVQAIPDTGYLFDYWEVDGVNIGSSNPVNVTMNSNHNLCAIFTYDVTVIAYCYAEGGNVGVSIWMDGSPTGYTTPHAFTNLTGTRTFTVPSIDANGHTFKQWNMGQTNTTITVNSGGTYTAYYDMAYILTITTTTGGSTDPASGTYIYWSGSIVSVTAIPDAGYYLYYWELDGVNIGSSNAVDVHMAANHTLHAVFGQFGSGHNVAVKGLSTKSVVGQGFPSTIEATTMNVGGYTETFDVTVYANATIIQTLTVYNLMSGNSTIVTFTWDTTSFAKGNYTMTATATPVPGETSTADNTLTDGWVFVAMVGDLTGPELVPDGLVDIDDIVLVAISFGAYPGHERWNPNADITNDGLADIDDVAIIAIHFGETDP